MIWHQEMEQRLEISTIVKQQREYFFTNETLDIEFRLESLKKLMRSIQKHEEDITAALNKDLNKSAFEAYETEIGIIYNEIRDMIRNLPRWSRIKRVPTPITQFKASSYICSEPYGVTLILSPWNYPFQLTMAPLAGSIAGGNCTVLKPSAYSPNTSQVIREIIEECFDKRYVAVVEGGREANGQLLKQKFDYIFFTGSVSVGKIVMEEAAKNLTHVTLELGGKSPCIVHRDADADISARRIIWGKCVNSGQTCVAPDYILVHEDIKDELILNMKKYIKEFWGDKPCCNSEFPRIVNEKHFERLKRLLDSGSVAAGGDFNDKELKISPTILENVKWSDPVMQEEIFGPILPVITYNDLDDVINDINSHPKPLALYLFTRDKKVEKKIVSTISYGGGCINDTIVHLATSYMPFGGVGQSGMGQYHSKWSFDTFTHKKSIMKKSFAVDIRLRYPPYKGKLSTLKKLLK